MAGYLGTKAVLLSTTAADVTGDAEIGGDLTVGGNLTSTGIDVTGTVTADGLTVDGSAIVRSGNTLTLNRTDNGIGGAMSYVAGTGFLFDDANGDGTSFNVGATNRMRIDSSGNLLVGKTVATSQSTVGITLYPSGGIACTTSNSGTQYPLSFSRGNAFVGTISTSASATSYNTSSDYRLKTDAQPMTGASARVQALNPVNFEWIVDGSRVDGFLAHEAQEVVPEAVSGTKDAMRDEEYEVTPAVLDDDGNETTAAVMGTRSVPDYQGIDQSKLVPLLTAALQEALTKIDTMETRLAALEGN